MDHKEEGREACRQYYSCNAYKGLSRTLSAEDAIKIFLPCPEEQLLQMETPMAKSRVQWIKGWRSLQPEMIAGESHDG